MVQWRQHSLCKRVRKARGFESLFRLHSKAHAANIYGLHWFDSNPRSQGLGYRVLVDLGELAEWSIARSLNLRGGVEPSIRPNRMLSSSLGTMAEPGLKQLLAKESTYIVWRPEVQILLVPPTEFDGVWRSLV